MKTSVEEGRNVDSIHLEIIRSLISWGSEAVDDAVRYCSIAELAPLLDEDEDA